MTNKILTEGELLSLIYEGNKNTLIGGKKAYCEYCNNEIPHFHASQIGYCPRRQQYDILHKMYPKKMSGYSATWLRDGMLNEAIIKEGLEGSGIKLLWLKANTIKWKDVIIVTHYDLVIEHKKVKYVLEIKSVKDWSWNDIVKKGILPFRYVQQLMLYQADHKITHGFVIVKRRMTSEMLPFYFKFDPKVVKDILVTKQSILDHTKKQKIIARPYKDKKNFECKRMCSYNELCWSTKQ